MKPFAHRRAAASPSRGARLAKWSALALALLCVVACPARVPAQDEPVVQTLPFDASYDGRWDGQQLGSDMSVQVVGSGHATFLPASWAYFNPVLDLSTSPDITISGTFELAGPDATFIDGTFEGQATLPDETGNSFLMGTYTLTNGTGRFSNVQGSGDLMGMVNINDGTSRITLSGEIVPPQTAQS